LAADRGCVPDAKLALLEIKTVMAMLGAIFTLTTPWSAPCPGDFAFTMKPTHLSSSCARVREGAAGASPAWAGGGT